MRASGAAIGFAFDGDGDRVVAVDSSGTVRDGDELIALIAAHLHRPRWLAGGVAVTVMSNYGFHRAMEEAGIEVATTPVGDRSVSAELERRGLGARRRAVGHLIWTDFAPTGDGIAAALLARRRSAAATSRGAADRAAAAGARERRGRRPRRGRATPRALGGGRARGHGASRAAGGSWCDRPAPSRCCG